MKKYLRYIQTAYGLRMVVCSRRKRKAVSNSANVLPAHEIKNSSLLDLMYLCMYAQMCMQYEVDKEVRGSTIYRGMPKSDTRHTYPFKLSSSSMTLSVFHIIDQSWSPQKSPYIF